MIKRAAEGAAGFSLRKLLLASQTSMQQGAAGELLRHALIVSLLQMGAIDDRRALIGLGSWNLEVMDLEYLGER